jgi:hypothetical protein
MRLMTIAVLAGSLWLTGCVGKRSGAPVERTVIEVDNRGFSDMTIYVVDGASRLRLGTALGLKRTDLTIPPRAVGTARDLQFLADPIGSSRSAVSQRLYVRQGDRVQLIIQP